MTGIFSQMQLLNHALSGSAQNHRVHSQNIANLNTPGYKTLSIDFDQLMNQLDQNADVIESADPLIAKVVDGLPERVDGNNVDMEREISELKKNALAAQAYTQLMASKLSTMRRAISS